MADLGFGVGNMCAWRNLSKIPFFCREGTLGLGGPEIKGGIGTKTRIQSLYLCS